jgi:hypothetical protein
MTERHVSSGYAPVGGVEVYWESRGSGGTPLVVVHGGFGLASACNELLEHLSERRRSSQWSSRAMATPVM